MKNLLVCMVVIAAACSKQSTGPQTNPEPAPIAEPAPEPAPPPAQQPAVAEDCVVTIELAVDKVTFSGGGVSGEAQLAGGPDLGKLAPLAGKCAAIVKVADGTRYQDVISVLDATVRQGITDVSLGDAPAAASATSEFKTSTKDDVMMCGRYEAPDAEPVQEAPIIALTKTEAFVGKKKVGKLGDPKLAAALEKALPPKPSDPTIILQADASLPYVKIQAVIKVAEAAGYTNVLYAVKTKS